MRCTSAIAVMLVCLVSATSRGEETPKRLLLLAQGPDGHPRGTHEYVAGQNILKKCLAGVPGLETTIVRADDDWPEGPELLANADGVVLFVSQGARWLSTNPERRSAFNKLAARKGGLSVIHWGMGTKDARHIDPFVRLFGACHGGPDRKYKFLETEVQVAAPDHPAVRGIADFRINEEFYYQLKQQPDAENLVPLLTATIEGARPMVAWAWTRPDGGRSFGYSGCHFHENWSRPEHRRFLAQGVLWTLQIAPPQRNFPAEVTAEDLALKTE